MMPRPAPLLPYPDYLDHIRAESARFRAAAVGAGPAAPVPSCPGWTVADLVWHLGGEVQHFWRQIIERRPAGPSGCREAERPDSFERLVELFDDTHAGFVAALEVAGPEEPAWSWSEDHTVGFTFRRQAHEVLIHRLDAELAAEAVTPLDPRLAADGVHEVLAVMLGHAPEWARWEPLPHHVRVDCTDTDTQIWVQLGLVSGTAPDGERYVDQDDIRVVEALDGEPDVVVEGTAEDLDAWLWRRRDDDRISLVGDPLVQARFRACVDQPIT